MKTLHFPARRQTSGMLSVRPESFDGALRLIRSRHAVLRDDRRRLQASLARLRWQTRQVTRTARTLLRCAERLRRCQDVLRPSS
jgi:hypothetical protein